MGAEVQRGDVLFEIDSRPYQADLNRVEANMLQAEAKLKRLESDYQRAVGLVNTKVMTREEFDKVSGDRNEALANIDVVKANLDLAKLNLSFTKVRAPISGTAQPHACSTSATWSKSTKRCSRRSFRSIRSMPISTSTSGRC